MKKRENEGGRKRGRGKERDKNVIEMTNNFGFADCLYMFKKCVLPFGFIYSLVLQFYYFCVCMQMRM